MPEIITTLDESTPSPLAQEAQRDEKRSQKNGVSKGRNSLALNDLHEQRSTRVHKSVPSLNPSALELEDSDVSYINSALKKKATGHPGIVAYAGSQPSVEYAGGQPDSARGMIDFYTAP